MENIGLQLYSIKELTQKDFPGSLRKVAELGYDGVEFAGYFNTPAADLRKILADAGLKSAGSHVGIDSLTHSLDQVLAYSLEINDPYIICPFLPTEMRNSLDAYKRTAEQFNKIGQKCKENHIRLGYHNHGFEFEKFDDRFGLDILFEYTQPDLLFMELDTFWVEYSGLRSVDVINQYKQRCPVLHIKDMKSMDEKINTEIGNGIMDFKEITALGKKYHVEWYTIEQEEFEKPYMQSVQEGLDYLRTIL